MIKIVMMIGRTQGVDLLVKLKIKNAVTLLSFFQTHTQVTVDNRYREV